MNLFLLEFKNSARSLAKVQVLVGVSLFCAMAAVLNMFKINLTADLRISFTFLAVAASCYFYGPVPNLAGALILDFLSFLNSPSGPYFPGFALSAMLQALIFSAFFYQQPKIGWKRIVAARTLVMVLCNILLNSLWLKILYDTPFWTMLIPRIIKNVLLLPVECILLYLILQACTRLKKRLSKRI